MRTFRPLGIFGLMRSTHYLNRNHKLSSSSSFLLLLNGADLHLFTKGTGLVWRVGHDMRRENLNFNQMDMWSCEGTSLS